VASYERMAKMQPWRIAWRAAHGLLGRAANGTARVLSP
jgi:hypothetical protein